MTAWMRAAVIGMAAGTISAVLMIALAMASAHNHPVLWLHVMRMSLILFPTHIFLLPLAESISFPHDLGFYFLAVFGNGILYSVVAQVIAAIYMLIKRIAGGAP